MDSRVRSWALGLLVGISPVSAGERFIAEGYAESAPAGILMGRSVGDVAVLSLPADPGDRYFVPPSHVRWEVELTGELSGGIPVAKALRSAPDDYAWPAGEEFSPARFAGASNAMNPFENALDPLGVAPGGPPDYDQDGVPDEEDAFPGDPSESADTDGDGVGNNADPDDDGDGIPDIWEIANGLNPLRNDAAGDADGDGFSNLAEYEAGTAANNPTSFFRFKSVTRPSPGVIRLTWDGIPGRTYSLWKRPDLVLSPVLLEDGISAGLSSSISRDLPAGSTRDFYFLRAIVNPAP